MAWNVYEMLNEERHEVFIGMTEKDVGAEFELDSSVPPAPVRHWDFRRERVRAKAYKTGLTRHEAREVVRGYQPQPGWTLHREL